MIALDGNFAYSFLLGMFAAVNPCGFVMLPAYLMYFLGLESHQNGPGRTRASVQRALLVSLATSAGFIAVFLVVGTISRLVTRQIQDNAKYVSLVVGVGLIVLGVMMLRGWKPPLTTAAAGAGRERKRTFVGMFVFGAAYAIASIGCTIGFLVSAVFGSFAATGFVSGVVSVALYGVGMALVVTALTMTLAVASGGLLRVLRNGLRYIDRAAGVFIILTGLYLTWYWYAAITGSGTNPVTGKIDSWQGQLVTFMQRQGVWRMSGVLGSAVVLGFVFIVVSRRRKAELPSDLEPDLDQHDTDPISA
ncbi:MAG: cytochrome c biogenesis protein CcdA [Ilumatobacteraceae bacterium]